MMRSRESEEMYLETILLLDDRDGSARRVDIAAKMGVTKPSVTMAVKSLRAKGYVCDDELGRVRLTMEGRSRAAAVYERHHLITLLLMHIGAAPCEAEENACRIEHVISADLTEAIRRFVSEAIA